MHVNIFTPLICVWSVPHPAVRSRISNIKKCAGSALIRPTPTLAPWDLCQRSSLCIQPYYNSAWYRVTSFVSVNIFRGIFRNAVSRLGGWFSCEDTSVVYDFIGIWVRLDENKILDKVSANPVTDRLFDGDQRICRSCKREKSRVEYAFGPDNGRFTVSKHEYILLEG